MPGIKLSETETAFIRSILSDESSTLASLLECMEMLHKKGYTAVIKLDGGRVSNPYTVFLTPAGEHPLATMIRADEPSLQSAIIKVLRQLL